MNPLKKLIFLIFWIIYVRFNQMKINSSTSAYLHLMMILASIGWVWWMSIHYPKVMIFIITQMITRNNEVQWTNTAHFPSYFFTLLILAGYEYLASLRPFIADLAVAMPVYMFTGIFLALNLVNLTAQMKYIRKD